MGRGAAALAMTAALLGTLSGCVESVGYYLPTYSYPVYSSFDGWSGRRGWGGWHHGWDHGHWNSGGHVELAHVGGHGFAGHGFGGHGGSHGGHH